MITNTILGVPYYNRSIMAPPNPFLIIKALTVYMVKGCGLSLGVPHVRV